MRKKFTYLWLNEYSTTTFTEPETAQIGLNKKKKKGGYVLEMAVMKM